jgi:3-deoxy-D-manno-octulosonic acid (KDO) 8-phosphate synthase
MTALPAFQDLWNQVTGRLVAPPSVDPVIERLRQTGQEVVAEKRAMDYRAHQAILDMQAIVSAKQLGPPIVYDDASNEWGVITE